MTIEADFENAVDITNKMLWLAGAMRDLPASQRRSLVFQALVLAEGGSSLKGSSAPKAARSSASTSSSSSKKTGPAKSAKANGAATSGGSDAGPRAKIIEVLRAKPETPVAALAKTVFGSSSERNRKRVQFALWAMKGKQVRRVKGKRGAWVAV